MLIMKKNNIWFVTLLIFLFAYFYPHNELQKIFDYDFKVAVIQTSSTKFKSYLNLFDEKLKFIKRIKINYGGLSHCWDFPKILDKKVFINIKGTDFLLKSKVLELDFEKKRYKYHDVKQKFNTCFCVDQKNIYVANCTGNANITQHNFQTKLNKILVIPETYITHMKIHGNKLFAFGNFFHNQVKSFIYIIDTNSMKLIKRINIKDIGIGQYDSLKTNNNIFFTNDSVVQKNKNRYCERESNILCKLDISKNKTEKIFLPEISPKQIFFYKNNLIISHDDWHQNKKNLSIYNLLTQKIKLIKIKNYPYQIWLDKNKIYSVDQHKICKYNADSFALEREYNFDADKNLSDDFFISGFFICK